jgi:phasin family protein
MLQCTKALAICERPFILRCNIDLTEAVVADKPVAKTPVPAKPVAAKPVAKPVLAKPETAKPAEAPRPVMAAAVAPAKIEMPKIETSKIETPKPVAAAIQEGKKTMTDTFTKVEDTAKNFAADASARANDMFGDISTRAKTAMEKGSKSLEDMVEFSKGNLEAVVASGRVAAKGAQDIAKYSAEYGRKSIEDGNATLKQFAAVKSPTEFFQLQSEVAKKNLDAMVAESSKFAESYLKLLGEIVQPIQNRYAVAVEKVKTVVAA